MAGGGGGGGAGAAAALPFRLGPGSGRLMTVRQAGRVGPSGAGGSSAGGGGGGGPGAGGMSSSGRYCTGRKQTLSGLIFFLIQGMIDDHLGAPVWRVLAACAVLGLDCHQFRDLAGGRASEGWRWAGRWGGPYVLLQCAALVSELSDFLEKDADFARECFAEVVQVSVR